MKANLKFISLFFLSFLIASSISADTVELKSGGKLNGKITERNEESIKLQMQNGVVTIRLSDIVQMTEDEVRDVAAPRPKEKAESPKEILSENVSQNFKKEEIKQWFQKFLDLEVVQKTIVWVQNQNAKVKVDWEAKLTKENIIKWAGIFVLLFLIGFLVSAIILMISVKLVGGGISLVGAFLFEIKWFWTRTVLSVTAVVFLLFIQLSFFLISLLIPGAGIILSPGLALIGIIFAVGFPLYLFSQFLNLAEERLQLGTGKIILVIIIGIILKIGFSVLVKLSLAPYLIEAAKPYLQTA